MPLRADDEPFPSLPGNATYEQCIIVKSEQLRFLEIDHKIPIARGGTDTPENRVPACSACNSQKQKMTPDEYRAYLIAYGVNPRFFDDRHPQRDWLCVKSLMTAYSGIPAARKRFRNYAATLK